VGVAAVVAGATNKLTSPDDLSQVTVVAGATDELTSPGGCGQGKLAAHARSQLDLLFNAYDITDARKSKPSL